PYTVEGLPHAARAVDVPDRQGGRDQGSAFGRLRGGRIGRSDADDPVWLNSRTRFGLSYSESARCRPEGTGVGLAFGGGDAVTRRCKERYEAPLARFRPRPRAGGLG